MCDVTELNAKKCPTSSIARSVCWYRTLQITSVIDKKKMSFFFLIFSACFIFWGTTTLLGEKIGKPRIKT